jgi:hypothetical protein
MVYCETRLGSDSVPDIKSPKKTELLYWMTEILQERAQPFCSLLNNREGDAEVLKKCAMRECWRNVGCGSDGEAWQLEVLKGSENSS